jgi:hypothetical protein
MRRIIDFSFGSKSRQPVRCFNEHENAPGNNVPKLLNVSKMDDSAPKNARHPREGGDPFLPVNGRWIPAFAGMTIQGRRRHALL